MRANRHVAPSCFGCILFLLVQILSPLTDNGVVGLSAVSTVKNNAGAQQPPPLLPMGPDAMLRQASTAIRRAIMSDKNINRQTIRLPLSESMYSTKEESFVADRAIGWQGGPQETYRCVSPMVQQLLREIGASSMTNNDDDSSNKSSSSFSGLTPKVHEQVLLDFDGSSLINTESPYGPLEDSIAMIQPNTDKYYMQLIQKMEIEFSDTPGAKGKRLFLLINPAWRNADSWGFFERKQGQSQILDRYETTYAIDQFIVKGNKLSLLKVWPHDWCVYYTPLPQPGSTEEEYRPKLLGTFQQRPEYTEIERLVISNKG